MSVSPGTIASTATRPGPNTLVLPALVVGAALLGAVAAAGWIAGIVVLAATLGLIPILLGHEELIVLFVMLYFPFEQFLLKFLTPQGVLAAKALPELLIYAALGFVLAKKILKRDRLERTPVGLVLLALLLWGAFSAAVNLLPLAVGIAGLRMVFRFAAVFYLLAQLDLRERVARAFCGRFVGFLIGLVILEAVIGIAQMLIGTPAYEFLRAESSSVAVGDVAVPLAGPQTYSPGSRIFATMGRYDQLGSFIALGLVLALAFWGQSGVGFRRLPLAGVMTVALIQTFSRASIFAALLGVAVLFALTRKKAYALILVAAAGVLLIASVTVGMGQAASRAEDPSGTVIERVISGFEIRPWRDPAYGRAYSITVGAGRALERSPVIGIGPGAIGSMATRSLGYVGGYEALGVDEHSMAVAIGDVGWVSLLAQYGVVGLVGFVLLLALIFRHGVAVHRTAEMQLRPIGAAVAAAALMLAFWAFFTSPFELRYLSFYFWALAGLSVAVGRGAERETAQ